MMWIYNIWMLRGSISQKFDFETAIQATLFGYAKQVQKYLDFNDIKFANESVILTNQEVGYMIGMRTHQLGLASHNADLAAHFSVSSGSSGSGGRGGVF